MQQCQCVCVIATHQVLLYLQIQKNTVILNLVLLRCGSGVCRLSHWRWLGHHSDGSQHRPPGVWSGIAPWTKVCLLSVIMIVFFVMFEGGYSLLVYAANGRSSDRLHGGIWDQVCMEVCPTESGQTLLWSPAGDLDWHPHRKRTQGHLWLCVVGSWWVCSCHCVWFTCLGQFTLNKTNLNPCDNKELNI